MDNSGLSTRMRKKLGILPPPSSLVNVYPQGCIRLDQAENELLRPELLDIFKKNVVEKMDTDTLSYPPGFGGEPALLNSLASFFNSYFKPAVEVKPDHIAMSSGSGNSLDALLCTVCDEGDIVMMLGPCWSGYMLYMVLHSTTIPLIVPSSSFRNSLTMDCINRLQTAYDSSPSPSRIKALIVCNPHNPVDECYPEEVLHGLMSFCHQRDMHYISDEVQALCTFNNLEPFVSALSIVGKEENETLISRNRVHVIWSMSKDFGSPGVRMGCIISQANAPLLAGVTFSSFWQTSSLSSLYAVSILSSPTLPTLIQENSTRLQAAYKFVTEGLEKLGVEYIPVKAGVCLWAKLVRSGEEESMAISNLMDGGVAVARGKKYFSMYGETGWIRMLFAVPEDVMREALTRIERVLKASA